MPSSNYGVDINPENLKNGSLAKTLDPWSHQQTTGFQTGEIRNQPKRGSAQRMAEGEQAPKPADE